MKPKLLDLFCAAGGAGQGYADAGFEVVGVDLSLFKRYPFMQLTADALSLTPSFLAMFDAVHASPPCQGYTALRHAPKTRGAPKLIGRVRELLMASGKPWVIENVEEARWDMRDPLCLCGSMFGLGAQGHHLERHRLFESSLKLTAPCACAHKSPVIGVYGGHARNRAASSGGRGTRDVWIGGHKAAMSEAMGIDLMTTAELSEAIPPAYTAHLGRQLIEAA